MDYVWWLLDKLLSGEFDFVFKFVVLGDVDYVECVLLNMSVLEIVVFLSILSELVIRMIFIIFLFS